MGGPYTVEHLAYVTWVPLRTYNSYVHAVGLARDYAIGDRRFRVVDASGKVLWDSRNPTRGVPAEIREPKGR